MAHRTFWKSDITTRRESKAERVAREKAEERECYRLVDLRDEHQCRVCGRRVGGIGQLHKTVHHHLVYRSKADREMKHTTRNVLTICPTCDELVHRKGTMRLTGDADARDYRRKFSGVSVERLIGDKWEVVAWV
jgi:5-methylcytosine-specific restriction endonuclease McrA